MKIEAVAYLAAITLLSGLVFAEAGRNARLEAEVPLTPREVYGKLGRSQVRLQLVDVREGSEEGYEDTHIPGAIPVPGCDLGALPPRIRERVFEYAPTVIVSKEGGEEPFARCRERFTTAWNLEGGMRAWAGAGYPEDSGEYVPPRASGGGGCL